jgi:hypothetical protein
MENSEIYLDKIVQIEFQNTTQKCYIKNQQLSTQTIRKSLNNSVTAF